MLPPLVGTEEGGGTAAGVLLVAVTGLEPIVAVAGESLGPGGVGPSSRMTDCGVCATAMFGRSDAGEASSG